MSSVSYQAQYKKMTETPEWKLVVTLAIPAVVSILITNFYNLADTYFVSGLGVYESAATGIVYSLMAVIQAIGYMLGSGAGSIISRKLGAGEVENAKKCVATTFYFGIACGVVFCVLGRIFIGPLMYLLGSTDMILPCAILYGKYILVAVPAMIGSFVISNVLRNEGQALFAMFGLASGGILNVFGDYLLIRVFHMGISGAGLATCVSQYVSLFVLLTTFLRKKSQVSVHPRYFQADIKLILKVIFTGSPSMVRQGLFGLSAATLNHSAGMAGGEFAIAAMSIVGRVMNLLYCSAIGIGQGFQPVCGFNYGAKKYGRVRKAMIFMMLLIMVTLAVTALIGILNAQSIITMFRNEPEIIRIGKSTLIAQCAVMPLLAIQICPNMTYQSLGYPVAACFLASFRSGLFFIPIVIISTNIAGTNGLIYAQAIADVCGVAASLPYLIAMYRKLTKQMNEQENPFKSQGPAALS